MSSRYTLTPDQRQQFLTDGLVRLPRVIPTDAAEAMGEHIWAALAEQRGVLRDRPDTWKIKGPAYPPLDFRGLSRAGAFAAAVGPTVTVALDDFFGDRAWALTYPNLDPRPLGPIFPAPDWPWTVPTRHWHTDGTGGALWPESVRLFACVAPVEPGGGGTFYVAGSHQAVVRIVREMTAAGERARSATVIQQLKRESRWIADLCSRREAEPGRVKRFMVEGSELAGVSLRVAQMTGDTGDVILWHPNLLHTYSAYNHSSAPRLVVSATFQAKG
jgi:hypothetical protein